jgi:hypothetical protein
MDVMDCGLCPCYQSSTRDGAVIERVLCSLGTRDHVSVNRLMNTSPERPMHGAIELRSASTPSAATDEFFALHMCVSEGLDLACLFSPGLEG